MLLGIAAILSAIAWPIFASYAVYLLQTPLADFIRRITRLEGGASGVKTELQPPIQQISVLEDTNLNKEIANANKFSSMDPAYSKEYGKIDNILEQTNMKTTADQLEAMKRLFAIAATERSYEQIHRLIFASQFMALQQANMTGGLARKILLLETYNRAASLHSEVYKNIGFDDWTKFLLETDLFTVKEISNMGIIYEVTEFGRGYLKYAAAVMLPAKNF
ncbi:hypothetical protein ACQKQD_07665 [Methylobacterium sp. NPDC080182]|uniref:hypothetical protein n=1 Tax=Methylobacterium sp. NPDC080182 TaxID=3390590 RepID=UPI003CFF9489